MSSEVNTTPQGPLKSSQSLNSPTRRQVLWNVQEPGDPYDIKKSMIAKLPGSAIFMGQNMDIVCLLQAAEIERLSDFLQNYRFKFRDIERNQLDRHSYEVQIKELSQKIQDFDSYHKENQKLKSFVQRQGGEISLLQQSVKEKMTETQFRKVYERAQLRIRQLDDENRQLKQQNDTLQSQIKGFSSRIETFERVKAKEYEQLKQNYRQEGVKGQNQDQSLQMFKFQVEGELEKMKVEIRKLQEVNQSKAIQINLLKRENQESGRKTKLVTGSPSEKNIQSQYQIKIVQLNQQLTRASNLRESAQIKTSELSRQQIEYQQLLMRKDVNIKDLEAKLRNREEQIVQLNEILKTRPRQGEQFQRSQMQNYEYQSTIKHLGQRIDFLSGQLQASEGSQKLIKQSANKHIHENFSQIQELVRQNDQLRREALQNAQVKRQLVYLQGERALLVQQIQRLQQMSNHKSAESNQNRIISMQNQNLKAKMAQIQRNMTFYHESQVLKLRTQYQQRINQLSNIQGSSFQSRGVSAQQELQRCKEMLKQRKEEAERNKNVAYQWQAKYNQIELEQNYKSRNLESNLGSFRKQNQQLQNKIKQLSQLEIKLVQVQNKSAILEDEIQRLHSLIKSRQQEISLMHCKLKQNQDFNSRKVIQQNQKGSEYAYMINALRGENEELKKKYNQILNNSSNVNKQTINEINRLNQTMRVLQEQKVMRENVNRQLSYDLDYCKQNLNSGNQERQELRRTLLDSETKKRNTMSQQETVFKMVQYENQNLKRQLNEMQLAVTTFQTEVGRKINSSEQNMGNLTRQNDQLRLRLRDIQMKLTQQSRDNENFNQNYQQKSQQYQSLQLKYRSLSNENQDLRRQFKDYELTITSKYQTESSRKYSTYEMTINNLTRDHEQMRKRYADLESKYNLLNNQHSQLNYSFKRASDQNENIRRDMVQRQGVTGNLKSQINRTIQQYQNSITSINRVNQDLQRKLTEKEVQMRQKSEEYQRLEVNFHSVTNDIDLFKRKYHDLQQTMTQKMQGEVLNKYILYDQTITQLAQDNDGLRRKLSQKVNELNQKIIQINNLSPLYGQTQNLRNKVSNYESSINLYEKEVGQRFATFEQHIQRLEQENGDLRKMLQQGAETTRKVGAQSEDKISNLSRELERTALILNNFERENNELKNRANESGEMGRTVTELQNKVAIISQEIERVNQSLRSKIDDCNKLQLKNRNIILDMQNVKKQNLQLQSRFSNRLNNQVNLKYQNYQNIINELKRKVGLVQADNQRVSYELERLNSTLKVKGDESSQINYSYNNLLGEYEEFKRRSKETEMINNHNLASLQKQNQEFRRTFQEFQMGVKQLSDDNGRKTVEYENKIALLRSQNQRLNQTFALKTNQMDSIIKQTKSFEVSINQKTEYEMKNKMMLQTNLTVLSRQNDDLKRKIQQLSQFNKKIPEYEQKINSVIHQNQQLQHALRGKSEQLANAQAKLRQLTYEVEQSNRKAIELERSLISKYEMEVSMKSKNLQQNMNSLSQQRQNLQRKMVDYEAKIVNLTNQIQRLNGIMRSRTEELQRQMLQTEQYKQNYQRKVQNSENELFNMKTNYQSLITEYEQSKSNLQKYQVNTDQLYNEFKRFEVIIDELKLQRQKLYDKNYALSSEIQRLTEENTDLQFQSKDLRLKLSDEMSLQKRINEHMAIMVVLFAEVQSLRKRVVDKEKQVEAVRRTSLSPYMSKH